MDQTAPPPVRRFAARIAARLPVFAIVIAGVAGACYEDPQAKMDQMQQMNDLVDVVNELNSRTSEMGFTLDSLRGVVARQDTAIYRLANLAGVPYSLR